MINFVLAMLWISASWILLMASFCSIGFSAQRLFGFRGVNSESTLSAFWIGWCLVLMFLQVWHLVAPVDARVIGVLLIASVAGIAYSRQSIAELLELVKSHKLLLIAGSVLLLWLANRAMAPIKPYDAGLYHLGAIRWISNYPIVPGLANLHDRFGFNSSYFLFEAMLDTGMWTHGSHHLAGGLLLLIVLFEIGSSVYKIFNYKSVDLYDIMRIILLAPIIDQCFNYASSTSPDLATYVIGLTIGVRMCKVLFSTDNRSSRALDIASIMLLAAIGITLKVSFVILGTVASLIAATVWLQSVSEKKRSLIEPIVITAVVLSIVGVWMFRNIILTGYAAYPFSAISFGVEWRVTPESVTNINGWIQSWARNPNALPAQVLANSDWFYPWINYITAHQRFDVVFPLLLFLGGTVVSSLCVVFKTLPGARCVMFLMPGFAALIFWFLSAPDPRYAGATFWYLGAGSVSLVFGGFSHGGTVKEGMDRVSLRACADRAGLTAKLQNYTAWS